MPHPRPQLAPYAHASFPQDARAILAEGFITVIDEAYVEFSSVPSLASLLPHYANLVICRTLSKWAGLAGVRVGYSIAHEEISNKMMAIKYAESASVIGRMREAVLCGVRVCYSLACAGNPTTSTRPRTPPRRPR